MIKKISLSEAPKVSLDLEGYKMHSSSSLEVIHLCLKPGQVIAQHPNPYDVVAMLIEGSVTLNMEDTQIPLALFDVVEIEKHSTRGFSNTGLILARLIIIKKT